MRVERGSTLEVQGKPRIGLLELEGAHASFPAKSNHRNRRGSLPVYTRKPHRTQRIPVTKIDEYLAGDILERPAPSRTTFYGARPYTKEYRASPFERHSLLWHLFVLFRYKFRRKWPTLRIIFPGHSCAVSTPSLSCGVPASVSTPPSQASHVLQTSHVWRRGARGRGGGRGT